MQPIELASLTSFNPVTATPLTSLDVVVRQMYDYGIHHMPVVDGDYELVGMLSDFDIAMFLDRVARLSPVGAELTAGQCSATTYVSEVLTQSVMFVTDEDPPFRALKLMLDHNFHSVPVVQANRLHGIITTVDFLRELSYGGSQKGQHMLRPWIHDQLQKVDFDMPLDDARKLLRSSHSQFLTVVSDDQVCGVLSDRALRRARLGELLHDADAESEFSSWKHQAQTVGELLPKQDKPLHIGQTLSDAAAAMLEQHVFGLPVVDDQGLHAGVITELELLIALARTEA